MAIEQKFTDLINAAIDGDISDREKADLDAFLASSDEGRDLYDQLTNLCSALDALGTEEPPVHLRHIIMNNIRYCRY
jgi:hypothetical protein